MPRLTMSDRPVENQSGHWLLAQVGKKVLRPGGRELTEKMLSALPIHNHDVVELGPGLGKTAEKIVAEEPSSYTGVDEDPDAAHLAAAAAHQAGRDICPPTLFGFSRVGRTTPPWTTSPSTWPLAKRC